MQRKREVGRRNRSTVQPRQLVPFVARGLDTAEPHLTVAVERFRLVEISCVVPTDAERWRFLADHRLTLHTDGGDYMVHWCRTAGLGEPPKFYPVSNGRTPEEAIDRAIARYNRKHQIIGGVTTDANEPAVRRLFVRGWVS